MLSVAIKMLLGDRAKYLGLIFGVTFATLLISQQVSIFIGLMARTVQPIYSVPEADIWVMDTRVRYVDEVEPMRDVELTNVRSVPGVQWAVPYYKELINMRMPDGVTERVQLVGIDDVSMVGLCTQKVLGDPFVIKQPQSAMMDLNGYYFSWPGEPRRLGHEIEINDHRFKINAICGARPTFYFFPIIYVSYTTAMEITSPQRNKMPFILVKAQPGLPVQELKGRIVQQTGLQALTSHEFAWRSLDYYLERTGIPINFGITILLGVIIGIAITAQTFYLFVIENMKQFAAMKAMGVTNGQIFKMVVTQATIVCALGYSLGIALTTLFFTIASRTPALAGIGLTWQVMVGAAFAIMTITIISVAASLRKVFKLEPAIVFRG